MDYVTIANGIIKNTEMYQLYYDAALVDRYNHVDESFKHDLRKIIEFYTDETIAFVIELYNKGAITSKNVLFLIDYIDTIISKERDEKTRLKMTRMMRTELIEAFTMPETTTDVINKGQNIKNFLDSPIVKKHMRRSKDRKKREIYKALKRYANDLLSLNAPFGSGNRVDSIIKTHRAKVIKETLDKYTTNNDLRIKKSPYREVLQNLFKNETNVFAIEAVIDNQPAAKIAYEFALNRVNEAEKTITSPEAETYFNALKAKYEVLLALANSTKLSPEDLAEKLQCQGGVLYAE